MMRNEDDVNISIAVEEEVRSNLLAPSSSNSSSNSSVWGSLSSYFASSTNIREIRESLTERSSRSDLRSEEAGSAGNFNDNSAAEEIDQEEEEEGDNEVGFETAMSSSEENNVIRRRGNSTRRRRRRRRRRRNSTSSEEENENDQLSRELIQFCLKLQNILPFLILLVLYFVVTHVPGILLFIIGTIAIVGLDKKFRHQVALKDKASTLNLLAILCMCVLDGYTISVIDSFPESHYLMNVIRILPPLQKPTLPQIFWVLLVNDFTFRFFSIALKCVVALIKIRSPLTTDNALRNQIGIFYRQKKKLYALIEYTSLFSRTLIASISWYAYYRACSSKFIGSVFILGYGFFKGTVLTNQSTYIYRLVVEIFVGGPPIGRYVSDMSSINNNLEAGSCDSSGDCSICYDNPMVNPVELPCLHIFCEECLNEWVDRERSCPLCRADVSPSSPTPVQFSIFNYFIQNRDQPTTIDDSSASTNPSDMDTSNPANTISRETVEDKKTKYLDGTTSAIPQLL